MVATKIGKRLQPSHKVTIVSIETLPADMVINNYDAVVVGFPTIHASPSKPILTFIEQAKQLKNPMPAFLFTTCGLYSANTLRIFAKKCERKNIIPVLCKSYRCAATDGALIAPFMKLWFRHEKNLDEKVKNDVSDFTKLLTRPENADIPRFKLYSILNYPNKFFGQRFSPKIFTHQANCVLCGKCMTNCPTQSIRKDKDGYPAIAIETCIHCYRCIHHCPQKALSLSGKYPPPKTLYGACAKIHSQK